MRPANTAEIAMTSARYVSGFGNEHASEALPGTLPHGQNAPQRPPHGLYTEQISGTPFTAPRRENRRSWLYRIRPSAMHPPFRRLDNGLIRSTPFAEVPPPNRLRWDPLPFPDVPSDFIDGLATMGGNGDLSLRTGVAVHIYRASKSMERRLFADADGELLLVPQTGRLAGDRIRPRRDRPRRDRGRAARRQIPRRPARRPGPRLCLRELRGAVPPSRIGPDRRQRACQSPRFRDPGGRL